MLDGYQPGGPVVRVFAYQTDSGRPAEEIAGEAFAVFNDHPGDAAGAELACACCGRCPSRKAAVLPGVMLHPGCRPVALSPRTRASQRQAARCSQVMSRRVVVRAAATAMTAAMAASTPTAAG